MSVFANFATQPYKFLKLISTANGFKVEEEYQAQGIFKLRAGKTQSDNMETATSDAVIKVKPSEPFASESMVGHGIAITEQSEVTYRIEGQSTGIEHDTNRIDFYNLSLVREDFVWAEQEQSPLPLE
jgi:hypothetical protein